MPFYHSLVKDAVQRIKKGEYKAALHMYGLAYRHVFEQSSYGRFDKRCTAIANCVQYVQSLQKKEAELPSLRSEINDRIAMLRETREQKGINRVWFDAQIDALHDVVDMIVRRERQ